MKVQMTINEKKLDGHLWLDPSNTEFDQNYGTSVSELEDGIVTRFYGPQIVNYIPWDGFEQLFHKMDQKLRINGTVLLGGVEPYIISKKLVSRELPLETYNKLIFPYKANLISLPQLRKKLTDYKYQIKDIVVDYKTYQYTIEGVKC